MEKSSSQSDSWRRYLSAEKSLLDKLFWANAGGAIAVLSFIGGSIASNSEIHGVFVLILFILGMCSAIWSMFLSTVDEIIEHTHLSKLRKAVEQHYMWNPDKKFSVADFDSSKEFFDILVNQLTKSKAFADEEEITKISKAVINFFKALVEFGIIFSLASILLFISGCFIGILGLLFL